MIRSELFRQPHSKCRDMLRVGVLVEHGGALINGHPIIQTLTIVTSLGRHGNIKSR